MQYAHSGSQSALITSLGGEDSSKISPTSMTASIFIPKSMITVIQRCRLGSLTNESKQTNARNSITTTVNHVDGSVSSLED
jgi:hypothetical protein